MARLVVALVVLVLVGLAVTAERSETERARADPVDPCQRPLPWHLGRIDPRHDVSREELHRAMTEAAGVWEAAAGRRLFRPDSAGGMAVHLVHDERQEAYDRRQETAAELDRLRAAVDAGRSRLQGLESRLVAAQADHRRLRTPASRAALENAVDAINRGVAQYNRAVSRYNIAAEQAGAEVGLLLRVGDLRSETISVGGRVVRIERTLTVGLVSGYEELVLVLAHELGHALGIGHVAGADALMAERYRSDGRSYPVRVSPADRRALEQRCGTAAPAKGAPGR